jgi:tetratricopeptide (TPR) repeat protein
LSHLAADHDLTVYILAGKAHLAGDMRVSAATIAGHGYPLSGDHAAAERAYDRAHELFGTSDADPDSLYEGSVSEKWTALSRARSLTVLGDYRSAAQSFQHVIADLPSRKLRDRGVYLARAALAHAGDRQVEHAATLGLNALAIGADTRSGRILTELRQLNDKLGPWSTAPTVADFRTAMKDTVLHRPDHRPVRECRLPGSVGS